MIGTDEMSSTGMDISESFRPEDISKTDFFDFVTAPDMGIGLGVNVNLHHSHHNHQQQQHHHHHHHTQQQQQTQHQQPPQTPLSMTQQQQQHHHNSSTHPHHASQHQHQQHTSSTDRTMTHDGGGGNVSIGTTGGDSHNDASGLSDGSSASTTDPTLHGYEFWSTDKEHTSTIFEDLDRYCWQQQQSNTTASANNSTTSVMHHSSPAQSLNPLHSSSVNPASPHNHHSPATPVTTPTSLTSTPVPQTQLNSDGTISNIISTDGQIYTLTVLNGNEPWLKRDSDTHLNSTLDLDSLLGTFPGYIKSEYPYDDSGFSTDGCKDVNTDATNVMNSGSSGGGAGNGAGLASNQRLPSLLNTISVTSSGGGAGSGNVSNANECVSTALSIGQQLDQFHNNNNDWHMTDHNNEQNSAESLLRSALQGKGYAKGLHMHNGITLMSTSPTVKDDEMRRILFPVDTDGLNFSDTSLSAAQIFDDTQTANGHNPHMVVPHSPVTNGPLTPVTNNPNNNNNNNNNNASNQASSLIVDDMFLTLENAFSDDFEKIKQFCTAGSNTNDYGANDVMMQISPNGNATTQSTNTNTGSIQAVTTTHQPMLTSLHTSAITTTPNNACRLSTPVGGMATTLPIQQQQQQQQPPQPLKPEVTTSTQRIVSTAKVTKKYKRSLSTAHHNSNNNNNNNPNVINHNNNNNSNISNNNKGSSNNMTLTNGQTRNGNNSSSGSSTNSSNSPTHCNGLVAGGGVIGVNTTTTSSTNTSSTTSSSSSSSSATPGQRKERSLHYCSICSKGFKDKYSVNVHIRTHTGEKPFACTLCGKSFRQKAHLAKHYQTHMAQKNNGSLVKGSAGKHHRTSSAQSLSTSVMSAHNHSRSLSLASAPNQTASSMGGTSVGVGVGGLVSGILSSSGLPPLGVPVTASSAPTTPTTILPPANGLLANR